MAQPSERLRQFALTVTEPQIDDATKRRGALGGDAAVNIGNPPTGGAELLFGTVDISGGQADSLVQNIRLDYTGDGGNTLVENWNLFVAVGDNGFTGGLTEINFTAKGLRSTTESPGDTQLYVTTAVVGTYTWTECPATATGENLHPPDDGTSMVLSTTSDDAILWANYVQIDSGELTGTYKAADSGKEFRYSIQYSFS